jgi:hypothetical protein
MKIAVLAWSPIASGAGWRDDGPELPIEFAKRLRQGGIVPVMSSAPWVQSVKVLWVASRFDTIDLACRDLAARESVPTREIGHITLKANGASDDKLPALQNGAQREAILRRLRQWRELHGFDAVIWRDSRADLYPQGQDLDSAKTSVAEYLRTLEDKTSVAVYIREVPPQIWTDIREAMIEELGWLSTTPINDANGLGFRDWQECRTTIGRLDTIQEDLRKVGFSIITSLLTASTFLNVLGVSTAAGVTFSSPSVRPAIFIAVMVLIAALFSLDTCYQVLLSGAAERALDLEIQMTPRVRITRYLSINAPASGISYIILALYFVFLATAAGLGFVAAGGLCRKPRPFLRGPGSGFGFWASRQASLLPR